MRKLLRAGLLITFGLLILCIASGCGEDSPEVVMDPLQSDDTDPSNPTTSGTTPPRTDDAGPPPTVSPFSIDPAPGGTPIPSNTEFSLIFDYMDVVAVTVNGTAATGSGTNWTASPTLQEGDGQTLHVTWTNRDGSSGSQAVGPYTVRPPDTTPPSITRGMVADGSVNVNPAAMNAGIRFDFDEDVTGTIKLTDEAGAALNWIANVFGQIAILTPVAGQELVNETTYKIEIDVADGAGHPLQVTITFVTKPK